MATAAPTRPAQDDGGGDCYLCGGTRVVEDIDDEDGRDKPCPACRPAGWDCDRCESKGWVSSPDGFGTEPCPKCN